MKSFMFLNQFINTNYITQKPKIDFRRSSLYPACITDQIQLLTQTSFQIYNFISNITSQIRTFGETTNTTCRFSFKQTRQDTSPHLDFLPVAAYPLANSPFWPHKILLSRIIKVNNLLTLDDSWGWTGTDLS